jgi:ABC-type multidrug transport system fused ATPase/permease subunit
MEKQMIETINTLIKNGNEIMIKIYEIAIKQQKIKQVIYGMISFTFLIVFIFGIWFIIHGLKIKKNGGYKDDYETCYTIGSLLIFFGLFFFFQFFSDFLTFTFNPQYSALQDIVELFLKK